MAEKPIVAFLGPKASYTHQAALQEFDEDTYDIRAQVDIDNVFSAVQSGAAAAGVVPFENSSNGSVVLTLDLFADRDGRHPDILVTAEIYVSVKHCLLGHLDTRTDSAEDIHDKLQQPWRKSLDISSSPSSSSTTSRAVTPTQNTPHPGSSKVSPTHPISHITKLYSHPQAWGQCKLFLTTYLKSVERQDVASTSRAAEIVAAEGPSGTSAAISSSIAAKINNLTHLATGIEDIEGNTTRFFVIRRRENTTRRFQDDAPPASIVVERNLFMPRYKSLVIFSVENEKYGSFADVLSVFKKYDLNLTSCNSRPSGEKGKNWQYLFFVEFQGVKFGDGNGGAVNKCLEELEPKKGMTRYLRWLGSWENKLVE